MRFLIGFVTVCVLLLGAAVWLVVTARVPAPTAERTRTASHDAAAPATPTAAGMNGASGAASPAAARDPLAPIAGDTFASDTAIPTPVSTAASDVRWAGEPERRRAEERLAAARAVLADDPDHPQALRDACAALATLRRWGEVADVLARLRRLNPEDDALTFEHAVALMRQRRWMECLPLLTQLVERHPDDRRAWFNLAVAHQAVGHLADARKAWDRVIALRSDPAALARRGEVLLDLREWAVAAADFQAALAAQPGSADAALNLALAWWRMGRLSEARDCLRSFHERHPRNVSILNRLAEMAWAACRTDPAQNEPDCREAVTWWRQSLAIDPDQPTVRAQLETAEQGPSPNQ